MYGRILKFSAAKWPYLYCFSCYRFGLSNLSLGGAKEQSEWFRARLMMIKTIWLSHGTHKMILVFKLCVLNFLACSDFLQLHQFKNGLKTKVIFSNWPTNIFAWTATSLDSRKSTFLDCSRIWNSKSTFLDVTPILGYPYQTDEGPARGWASLRWKQSKN